MQKFNIEDFFGFWSDFLPSVIQAHAKEVDEGENGLNNIWHLIKGVYQDRHFPIVFKQEYGKKLADVLGTGYVSFYLISDRMKLLLEENHFTGWQVFPIKLYDKQDREIPGYYGFSVTGKCSPATYEGCEIIEKKLVECGPVCKFYKGISIDEWEGSDFFMPPETLEIFVSKKVANVLKKNKISNINLKNLPNLEYMVSPI